MYKLTVEVDDYFAERAIFTDSDGVKWLQLRHIPQWTDLEIVNMTQHKKSAASVRVEVAPPKKRAPGRPKKVVEKDAEKDVGNDDPK